jgi:hypothetical protein
MTNNVRAYLPATHEYGRIIFVATNMDKYSCELLPSQTYFRPEDGLGESIDEGYNIDEED